MSQLVPYLNFGFEDSQLTDNDLFYCTQDSFDQKMVGTCKIFLVANGSWHARFLHTKSENNTTVFCFHCKSPPPSPTSGWRVLCGYEVGGN